MTDNYVIAPLAAPSEDWYGSVPAPRTVIILFIMYALGPYCVVLMSFRITYISHCGKGLNHSQRIMLNSFFFYDFFSPSSRLESHHLIALLPQRWHQVLLFCSSAMCKNVILPYHEPNMQPFIQWLPVFICSASVGLSASRHQYLEWSFQCWHR